MSLLSIIRFIAVAVSLLNLVYCAPLGAIRMWLEPGLAITGTGVHSSIIVAGTYGIYVTAVVSIIIAFVGIPRWRLGASILLWCYLLMGVSILTRIVADYADRLLPWDIQVTSYTLTLLLALPPFIIAAMLSNRLVRLELWRKNSSV